VCPPHFRPPARLASWPLELHGLQEPTKWLPCSEWHMQATASSTLCHWSSVRVVPHCSEASATACLTAAWNAHPQTDMLCALQQGYHTDAVGDT
jgi:hypothetical protein